MDAIYARQSIDKKDSISIEGQIDLCRKECSADPLVFQDKGYSGKNTDRPAFKKLMEAVEKDQIDRIVVYRLDRISRSITDFGRVWDILNAHHAEFVSINEKFDTSTPVGRAMVYIIMVFAQLERETIAERVKDNYEQRARRGTWMGGEAPYGFRIERTVVDGKRASVLAPADSISVVSEIFNKYAYQKYSLGKIAKWLVEEEIPGARRKTWDNVAISRILHNPAYVRATQDIYFYYKSKGVIIYNEQSEFAGVKGLWLYGKRPANAAKYTNLENQLVTIAQHDGVVDSDTWLACQYRLEQNTQIKNTGTSKYSWLSGLVHCGYCGRTMRVTCTKDGYIYFRCQGRYDTHECNKKINDCQVASIEKQVSDWLIPYMDKLKAQHQQFKVQKFASAANLKQELSDIQAQIQRLIDALASSTPITMKYINDKISALDKRKNEIVGELHFREKQSQTLEIPDFDFDALVFDRKKEVARALIKRVTLTNEAGPKIETVI